MDEKLLLKCENTIYADEIASLLYAHGIASRLHDERQDTAVGAYGGVTGVAIFVFKKDYDAALALVAPIMEARNHAKPVCPKCGGEEVEPLDKTCKFGRVIVWVSLVFIFFPLLYIAQRMFLEAYSDVADIVALVLFFSGWGILFLGRHTNDNFKCKECGKSFRHFQSH